MNHNLVRYHYFLLDFCYLANLILLFYLHLYPSSPHLFVMNFVNGSGPLAFAIIMWRNSLVFHSIDKLTSIFIHFYPPLITFAMRWMMNEENGIVESFGTSYAVCINPDCSISLFDIFIPHILIFIFWQVCYNLKTQLLDRAILKEKPNLQTSYRWLTESKSLTQSWSEKLYGKRYKLFGFITLQFIFHMLTVIPVIFMYRYFWFNVFVLLFVLLCSGKLIKSSGSLNFTVWNGASFYFERFAKNYVNDLKKIAEELEKENKESNQD